MGMTTLSFLDVKAAKPVKHTMAMIFIVYESVQSIVSFLHVFRAMVILKASFNATFLQKIPSKHSDLETLTDIVFFNVVIYLLCVNQTLVFD